MIQQKSNLDYMSAYARYTRCRLIHCKYTPINQYTLPTIESHLTTDFLIQKYAKTHEIILIKPMFLSQKDSKPHWSLELKENFWCTGEEATESTAGKGRC